jgi:hypothetical protein
MIRIHTHHFGCSLIAVLWYCWSTCLVFIEKLHSTLPFSGVNGKDAKGGDRRIAHPGKWKGNEEKSKTRKSAKLVSQTRIETSNFKTKARSVTAWYDLLVFKLICNKSLTKCTILYTVILY